MMAARTTRELDMKRTGQGAVRALAMRRRSFESSTYRRMEAVELEEEVGVVVGWDT